MISSSMQPAAGNPVAEALVRFMSSIPASRECAADDPGSRAAAIASAAAGMVAKISGGMALVPGPLGMLTIIPDLIATWKVQAQMVSDIAACYGKTGSLSREQMLYCLFRHAVVQVARDLAVRAGERILVRRASLQAMRKLLERVGVSVTQRAAAKGVARWLPVVGALGIGAYGWYDTKQVAEAAMELFAQPDEPDGGPVPRDHAQVEAAEMPVHPVSIACGA